MNMLTEKAEKQLEEVFRLKHDALEIFKLVVMEWKSDPQSVQCFDLRIVEKAIQTDASLKKLDVFWE